MKIQRPIATDGEHRVLQFRPRNALHAPLRQPDGFAPPKQHDGHDDKHELLDLSRYERRREAPDDFRQRMLGNIAGLAFTVALTAIGIWLVISISDLRRTQDCMLMGRRDCVRISTQPF